MVTPGEGGLARGVGEENIYSFNRWVPTERQRKTEKRKIYFQEQRQTNKFSVCTYFGHHILSAGSNEIDIYKKYIETRTMEV